MKHAGLAEILAAVGVVVPTSLLVLFLPACSPQDTPYLQFLRAYNAGADCPLLRELRNEAKRRGATEEQQKLMNEKLRVGRCTSSTSKRVPEGPPIQATLL